MSHAIEPRTYAGKPIAQWWSRREVERVVAPRLVQDVGEVGQPDGLVGLPQLLLHGLSFHSMGMIIMAIPTL